MHIQKLLSHTSTICYNNGIYTGHQNLKRKICKSMLYFTTYISVPWNKRGLEYELVRKNPGCMESLITTIMCRVLWQGKYDKRIKVRNFYRYYIFSCWPGKVIDNGKRPSITNLYSVTMMAIYKYFTLGCGKGITSMAFPRTALRSLVHTRPILTI